MEPDELLQHSQEPAICLWARSIQPMPPYIPLLDNLF